MTEQQQVSPDQFPPGSWTQGHAMTWRPNPLLDEDERPPWPWLVACPRTETPQ